jgi:hypothetical protein
LLSRSTCFPSLQKSATVGVGSTPLKFPEQPTWSDITRVGCLVFTHLLREIDKLPGRLVNTYLLNQSKQGLIPTWHTNFQNSWGDDQCNNHAVSVCRGDLHYSWCCYLQICSFTYFIPSLAVDNLPPVQPSLRLLLLARLMQTHCATKYVRTCFEETRLCLPANRMLDRLSFLRRIDCSSTPRVRATLRLHMTALQCTIRPRRLAYID